MALVALLFVVLAALAEAETEAEEVDLSEIFQIKSLTREVNLRSGTIVKQKIFVSFIAIKPTNVTTFVYGVEAPLDQGLSYYRVVDKDTREVLPTTFEVVPEGRVLTITFPKAPSANVPTNLTITLHIANGARFLNRYSSVFAPRGSPTDGPASKDRHLRTKLCTTAQVPYDVSTQTTKVYLNAGAFESYDADLRNVSFSVRDNVLTVGPVHYAEAGACVDLEVNYYADALTLEVSSQRRVYLPGVAVGTKAPPQGDASERHADPGVVHIIDTITCWNTDPTPGGKRFSRPTVWQLATTSTRVASKIPVRIPGPAANIRVYDRIGKIASFEVSNVTGGHVVSVTPRHYLFGGDMGKFTIEYDVAGAQSVADKAHDFLLDLSAAPGFETAYFSDYELCVYPPSGSTGASVVAPFVVEATVESSEERALDFEPRRGVCLQRGLTSSEITTQHVLVRWTHDTRAAMLTKMAKIASGVFMVFGATTLFRLFS